MIHKHYRWVIVAAGGLIGCIAVGAMFSLPVFLLPIARDTGWSVTGISTAMTIGFLSMAFASMIWGGLSDRWGPRPVVMAGSVLLATSLFAASLTTSLLAFQFVFGLVAGVAGAAVFAPMIACVAGWVDTHRSPAVRRAPHRRGVRADVVERFHSLAVGAGRRDRQRRGARIHLPLPRRLGGGRRAPGVFSGLGLVAGWT